MPKASPHFDSLALLQAVAQQDLGLRVSTNDPAGFRRILYGAMRAAPHLKARIYQCPRSRSAFLLLKPSAELPTNANLTQAEEPADDQQG